MDALALLHRLFCTLVLTIRIIYPRLNIGRWRLAIRFKRDGKHIEYFFVDPLCYRRQDGVHPQFVSRQKFLCWPSLVHNSWLIARYLSSIVSIYIKRDIDQKFAVESTSKFKRVGHQITTLPKLVLLAFLLQFISLGKVFGSAIRDEPSMPCFVGGLFRV